MTAVARGSTDCPTNVPTNIIPPMTARAAPEIASGAVTVTTTSKVPKGCGTAWVVTSALRVTFMTVLVKTRSSTPDVNGAVNKTMG